MDLLPSSLLASRTVLLVPFEDRALLASVRQQVPSATLRVVTKADLAGLSLAKMVRLLRSEPSEAAIVSGAGSATRRHATSLELLLCVTRARRRFFRTEGSTLREVSRAKILILRFPQLVVGALLGIVALALNWMLAFMFADEQWSGPPVRRSSGQRTILFLRADLAGPLRAGGSVSHVRGVVDALVRSGHRVVYVADALHPGLDRSVRQVLVRPLEFLGFFDEFQQLTYNLQLLWALRSIMRDCRPDIVYQRHTVFNFAGGWASRRVGVPLVLEANASEVWVKRNWSRLTFEKVATLCEGTALKLAAQVAVISEGVRDQLRSYNIPPERVLIVPNGVDPQEFRPDIDGASIRRSMGFEGAIVVGFAGSFTKWHGVETLRDAILHLSSIDDGLRFLLIGDGDLRSAMQHSIEESGRAGRCRFTGVLPHGEVPTHLAACDILVAPHLGFEGTTRFFGSPTKLFEYMAMGRAIVASDLEQLGEIIRDGVNGLHMRPGSASDLVCAILQLRDDPALRDRLGRQARQDAAAQHTWDHNVRKILGRLDGSDADGDVRQEQPSGG